MQQQKNIDKYLQNQMSKEERARFEQQLEGDPELRKALELQKGLQHFFATRAPDLERQLEELGKQYFTEKSKKTSPYVWIAVASVLLMIVILLLMPKDNQPTSIVKVEPTDTIKQKEMPIEVIPQTDSIKEKILEPQKEEISSSKPPTKTNEKKTTPKPKERPMAQLDPADFKPNPFLEDLMQSNLRSDDLAITVSLPKRDVPLPYQEKVLFQLIGQTNAAPPYRIKLFSNKISDFEEDIQLLNTEFEGLSKEAVFDFRFTEEIALERGLYYYLLEEVESGALLFVSSFEVL